MPMDAETRQRIYRNMPSAAATFMDEAAGTQADWKGWVGIDMWRRNKIWLPAGTPYRMELREVPEGWYCDTAGKSPPYTTRNSDPDDYRLGAVTAKATDTSDSQRAGNRQGWQTPTAATGDSSYGVMSIDSGAKAPTGGTGDSSYGSMSIDSGSGMDKGHTEAAPLQRMLSSHAYDELVGAGKSQHDTDIDTSDLSDSSPSWSREPKPIWSAKARELPNWKPKLADGAVTNPLPGKDAQIRDDDSSQQAIPSIKPYRPSTTSMSDGELILIANSGFEEPERQAAAKAELVRRTQKLASRMGN